MQECQLDNYPQFVRATTLETNQVCAAVLLGASIAMSELAKEKATPHKTTPKAQRPSKKVSARFTSALLFCFL